MSGRNKRNRVRRPRRQGRYRNFFKGNQQVSRMLRLGNGPVTRKKITSIETIHYINGDYKWKGANSQLANFRINDMEEFDKFSEDYRLYRVRGVQLIFTKRFALDIPLSGDDQKVASALAFNIYPGYQAANSDFKLGDSTKIVPVTLFGSKTFNVEFRNIFDVTQWKKVSEQTYVGIQIAPLTTFNTESQVDIPIYDVMVHFNVEFTQPV